MSAPPTEPDDLVVLIVRTAKALVERVQAERGHDHSAPTAGFTVVHGLAARYLASHDDVTAGELARYLRITKQSTSEVVAQLEQAGIVQRAPHPRDRRARILTLTDDGRTRLAEGRGRFAAIEDEWAAVAGREQLDTVRAALLAFLDLDAVRTEESL